MDTARQVLRYSIPGSLLIAFSAIFYVAAEMLMGSRLDAALTPLNDNINPAAAIALTVPTGFVLYQIYHHSFKPYATRLQVLSPILGGRVATLDRGALILSYLTDDQLSRVLKSFNVGWEKDVVREPSRKLGIYRVSVLKPWQRHEFRFAGRGPAPEGPKPRLSVLVEKTPATGPTYRRAWHRHQQITRVLKDATVLKHPTGPKDNFTQLLDIAHSLGAARYALLYALLIGLGAAVVSGGPEPPGELLLAATGCGLLCGWLWNALRIAREDTLLTACSSLGWALSAFLHSHGDVLDAIEGARDTPT